MTAVEWFAKQVLRSRQLGFISNEKFNELLEQAKEMEREEKIKILKSLVYSVCLGDDVEDIEEWLQKHELNKSE
jgi:oligoribonuclease NrnB/cAMP/cGMP phosphodiesterase (DHH superfamily)